VPPGRRQLNAEPADLHSRDAHRGTSTYTQALPGPNTQPGLRSSSCAATAATTTTTTFATTSTNAPLLPPDLSNLTAALGGGGPSVFPAVASLAESAATGLTAARELQHDQQDIQVVSCAGRNVLTEAGRPGPSAAPDREGIAAQVVGEGPPEDSDEAGCILRVCRGSAGAAR
jgi:hypothetical protein